MVKLNNKVIVKFFTVYTIIYLGKKIVSESGIMKVGFNVNRVVNAYTQNSRTDRINGKIKDKSDRIDISRESIEIRKYIENADDIEIKNKRVEEVKSLIEQNKYSVDSSELAKSILKYMKESGV